MGRKLTTNEFIQKAKQVHGNKYDYSKTDYSGSKNKVIIICPEHGEFEQKASNHLEGRGCPSCGGTKKLTKEVVFEKLKIIYNDKFKYTNVSFNSVKDKIDIICPEHGVFKQRIDLHLEGRGCPKCNKLHNNDDVINKFQKVHGNKYDYSLVEYTGARNKVKIICPVHGTFDQRPSEHKQGRGCERCGNRHEQVNVIENFKKIHGNKYDYSKTDYINTDTKVKIICPKHGEFEQRPSDHKRGSGCPQCKESKGESYIEQLLINKSIKYIREYRFNDCKNKRTLPFDFYLPEHNICIEYNGMQHYKPIPYFGGETKFIERQKNDKIKKEYCVNNGIPLIIVKYNDKIDNLLNNL